MTQQEAEVVQEQDAYFKRLERLLNDALKELRAEIEWLKRNGFAATVRSELQ
jgi:hypothetical protein